jgi:hypothetical protein
MFDQHAPWAFALLLEAMAFWLHCGIIVCRPNERDDEVFDCCEEL